MDNVFVMAGIPVIMQAMVESVAHRLVGGAPLISRTVTVDVPEGTLAEGLSALQDKYPEVEMGSYPFNRRGNLGVRLVLRSTEAGPLDAAAQAMDTLIGALGAHGEWD